MVLVLPDIDVPDVRAATLFFASALAIKKGYFQRFFLELLGQFGSDLDSIIREV